MILIFLSRSQGKSLAQEKFRIILESLQKKKEKYISFNVKIKLAGQSNKSGKKVRKNIQLRFIDSCAYMASSLDKLASNLCDTRGIQCDECKDDMKLVNIFSNYIALLRCRRCKTKKSKDLEETVLKKNFIHTSRYWSCY